MKNSHVGFTRRDFLRLLKEAVLAFIALSSGSLAYAHWLEAQWWKIEDIKIRIPGLPEAFSGFRLLQLSDIHMGGWMNAGRWQEVLKLAKEQKPDLIAITGDFVFGHAWSKSLDFAVEDFISATTSLTNEFATLGVMGNHDHWTDVDKVRSMLSRARIVELKNDIHTVRRDGDELHICGVDDVWEKKASLAELKSKLPSFGTAILLAHEPDFADEAARDGRFSLQLSGHSHGGQVVLPLVGAPILPYLGQKYPSGLYKVRDMWQYTNRGIGMIEPAIRFNCRPEITIITLKPG